MVCQADNAWKDLRGRPQADRSCQCVKLRVIEPVEEASLSSRSDARLAVRPREVQLRQQLHTHLKSRCNFTIPIFRFVSGLSKVTLFVRIAPNPHVTLDGIACSDTSPCSMVVRRSPRVQWQHGLRRLREEARWADPGYFAVQPQRREWRRLPVRVNDMMANFGGTRIERG